MDSLPSIPRDETVVGQAPHGQLYRRYAIVNDADLRDAAAKLAASSGAAMGTVAHIGR